MPKGSMLGIDSPLAIDPTSPSPFSDYNLDENAFINVNNPTATYSFYLMATSNTVMNTATSNFVKAYTKGGTYTVTASFTCNSVTFSSQTDVAIVQPSEKNFKGFKLLLLYY